jgi:hypothetical protein
MLEECADMLQRCVPPIEIRHYVRDKYNLTSSASQDGAVREARALLSTDYLDMEKADKAGEMVASLSLIMRKGIELGRGNDALGAARLISEITRIHKD